MYPQLTTRRKSYTSYLETYYTITYLDKMIHYSLACALCVAYGLMTGESSPHCQEFLLKSNSYELCTIHFNCYLLCTIFIRLADYKNIICERVC